MKRREIESVPCSRCGAEEHRSCTVDSSESEQKDLTRGSVRPPHKTRREAAEEQLSEKSVHVVIGVNQYPEDGFELIRAFDDGEEAEDYANHGDPGQDADMDWETYYATRVEK